MKTIKHLLLTLIASFLLLSCEEWLDVSPGKQVKSQDMLQNEAGFRDALIGIYSTMAETNIYGAQATFATMDVIAQYYSASIVISATGYPSAYNFIYDGPDAEYIINGMWNTDYYAIANCNNILDNIDAKKDIFSKGVYEMVKAETMALRAFLHLDLLRFFGPIPIQDNMSKPAIPIMVTLTDVPPKQSSISEVVGFVLKELDEARTLIAPYDLLGPGFDEYVDEYSVSSFTPGNEHYDDGGFRLYRRSRFNYYGMTALMARAALWAGQNAVALRYAQEVINAGKFPLMDENIYNTSNNLVVWHTANEYITSLYINQMDVRIHNAYFARTSPRVCFSAGDLAVLFGSDMDFDWRYRKFIGLNESGQWNIPLKYQNSTSMRMPLLKIGEMFLIAAEASGDISYLNTLRTHRGYINNPLPSDTDIGVALTNEYRREFFAEGQLFSFYKRRNVSQFHNGKAAGESVFVLPMPDNEIEFGNIITE